MTKKSLNFDFKKLPDQMKTKVTFYGEFTDAAFEGLSADLFQYRGNNPYDPQYATGGTTAMNWTIFNKWYRTYMVTSSKIKVEIDPANSAPGSALQEWLFLALYPADGDNSDIPDNYFEWMNVPNTQVKMKYIGALETGSRRKTLSGSMSTSKLYGRKMDPSLDQVAVSSAPNEEWLWNIYMYNRSETLAFVGRVWITYYVTFSEKVTHPTTYV